MSTTAETGQKTITPDDDEKAALATKISAEIWSAIQDGFQWLSTNVSSTEVYKTRSAQFPTDSTTTARATTRAITLAGSIESFPAHVHVLTNSSESGRTMIQSTLDAIASTAEPTSNTSFFKNTTSPADPRLYPHYPAYYKMNVCSALDPTTNQLSECEKPGMVILFGSFVFLLGLAAIVGNCVLPIVVWRLKKMRTRQNMIKVSLAFNDMIAGFILLFSVLPNVIWFRNSTEKEIIEGIIRTGNSPMAIMAGSSLIIALQGSLFHLMLLSADRFVAIKWPMWHRFRRKTSVAWMLGGIWMLTIMVSVITAAFPQYFNYGYNTLVFMYTLGYNGRTNSVLHGLLHFGLVLLFPYLATIVLTLLTGVVAFRELKTFPATKRSYLYSAPTCRTNTMSFFSSSGRSTDSKSERKSIKPELAVVKTIMIMTGSFVLAWSIFFVIFFLSYHGFKQSVETTPIIYMVSFYTGLSNSVANVIIYSVRDGRFRRAVFTTFIKRNRRGIESNGSSLTLNSARKTETFRTTKFT